MTSRDRCNVCAQDVSMGQMVSCTDCHMTVHLACYGLSNVRNGGRDWRCDWCRRAPATLRNQGDMRLQKCVMCPVRGGPLKSTDDRRFAHITCALYNPICTFGRTHQLSPILGADRAVADSKEGNGERPCSICGLKNGALIRCHESGCDEVFHPMCARVYGATMTTRMSESGGVEFVSYCMNHGSLSSCKVCGKGDRPENILLCDNCDAEYHIDCLDPPLKSIPEHEWFCPQCAPAIAAKRDGKLYCICKQPIGDSSSTTKYICCDNCNDWLHWSCAGIDEEPKKAKWVCPRQECQDSQKRS